MACLLLCTEKTYLLNLSSMPLKKDMKIEGRLSGKQWRTRIGDGGTRKSSEGVNMIKVLIFMHEIA
jgi:hypothetical protein